jgi:hypothetical protein
MRDKLCFVKPKLGKGRLHIRNNDLKPELLSLQNGRLGAARAARIPQPRNLNLA